MLRAPGGVLTGVLDWEFTGRFLPGLDAALLWIVLGHLPDAQQEAERIAGPGVPEQAGFWTNVAALSLSEPRFCWWGGVDSVAFGTQPQASDRERCPVQDNHRRVGPGHDSVPVRTVPNGSRIRYCRA